MASRTKPGDANIRRARLAKAEEFWAVAEVASAPPGVPEESPDAITSLLVLCGIAASEAICCARLGEFAVGDSHQEAVRLLTTADQGSGKCLSVLLGLKAKAAYSHVPVSGEDCKRARRAAQSLLLVARGAGAGL